MDKIYLFHSDRTCPQPKFTGVRKKKKIHHLIIVSNTSIKPTYYQYQGQWSSLVWIFADFMAKYFQSQRPDVAEPTAPVMKALCVCLALANTTQLCLDVGLQTQESKDEITAWRPA